MNTHIPMTVEEAIELADRWRRGAENQFGGLAEVLSVLVNEVVTLRAERGGQEGVGGAGEETKGQGARADASVTVGGVGGKGGLW